MQKLFISYARVDGREFAEGLRDDLRAEGFDAWMDTRIGGGVPFHAEIEGEIQQRDVLLAVMTHGSGRADSFCHNEVQYGLNCGKPVVSLRSGAGCG